jgi:heme exporter protein D
LFFMIVAAGVAPFCYVAGYPALAAVMGFVAVVLLVVVVAMARRAYRTEARQWYRCARCGAQWNAPEAR